MPLSELTWEDDFLDSGVTYRGAPFTGVAIEDAHGRVVERRFVAGAGEGRCHSTDHNGQLRHEWFLRRGERVGEERRFFADGSLHEHRRHDAPRSLRVWNAAGVLLEQSDENGRRRWYSDGARMEDCGRFYSQSGAALFVRRPGPRVKVYDDYVFEEANMARELESLVVDRLFEYPCFLFVHSVLDVTRARGIALVERLIVQEDLWVRCTALRLAGNIRATELLAVVSAMVGDARVPPAQLGRQASMSVSDVARGVLAQLRL